MPSVLVYGGSGQLGVIVVKEFKAAGYEVFSVDLRENPDADHSIAIAGDGSLNDGKKVVESVHAKGKQLDAVICVAGGFVMSNIKDDAIFSTLDRLLSFNLKSAVSCSYVASHVLKENALLILTGATAGLSATPVMIAYGLTKSATHHLVDSLSKPEAGLPTGTTVAAILPITLDTPQNRKDMPSANFDNWTPLEDVAKILVNWSNGKDRPSNGALVQIKTENKKTALIPVTHQ